MFSTYMCVWVGISLKSAVTPLIDGLLSGVLVHKVHCTNRFIASRDWFGLYLSSLLSVPCLGLISLLLVPLPSLSLSLSLLVIPFDGDGWCLFGQSGEECLQLTFLQSRYIHTLWERERARTGGMQWDILCEKKTVWFCFMCCACN